MFLDSVSTQENDLAELWVDQEGEWPTLKTGDGERVVLGVISSSSTGFWKSLGGSPWTKSVLATAQHLMVWLQLFTLRARQNLRSRRTARGSQASTFLVQCSCSPGLNNSNFPGFGTSVPGRALIGSSGIVGPPLGAVTVAKGMG